MLIEARADEPSATQQSLNIIIPIGGVGSRFAKYGYRYPKPLINIVGRPMLLWLLETLSLQQGDSVWIAINEDIDDEFNLGQLINKTLPKIDHHVLRLRHQTKGAAETLYIVSQSMTQDVIERKTLSLDCDTIYWADILSKVRKLPPSQGACFYFPDDGDKPVFSYIKTELRDDAEFITDIQEKKAISNKANTGAYVFPSAQQLRHWAGEILDMNHNRREIGEYYTSQLISHMLHHGVPYVGIAVSQDDISCVGTPEQLQEFLQRIKSGQCNLPQALQKRRFCFDLDMTLVGSPAVAGDYSTCPPIDRNIRLVQELHKAGHHIIIQTARRMRTHHGNVGCVVADIGPVTLAQLARYNIPFDEIHFGKPFAHVYVDDLAVNANLDTMRELGWYLGDADSLSRPSADRRAMVAARDFNTIQIIDGKVIKSSKSDNILGEVYFYSHMPPSVAPVFPAVYSVDYIPETSTYTITMENRKGLTFSHLLVGRSITRGRFLALLKALHTIHTQPGADQPSLPIPDALEAKMRSHYPTHGADKTNTINIYANYGAKLRNRYSRYRDRYDALGPLAASLFSRLDEFLDTYEAEDRGLRAPLIHGDPVFSNAILANDDSAVSFIDVRCQLGNTLTSTGDVNYDLAKVLQSLCGYDHVLLMSERNHDLSAALDHDKPLLHEADTALLNELQGHFFTFLSEVYSAPLHRKTLLRITASLFFSLIPLHRPQLGAVFLRMCKETLDKANQVEQ